MSDWPASLGERHRRSYDPTRTGYRHQRGRRSIIHRHHIALSIFRRWLPGGRELSLSLYTAVLVSAAIACGGGDSDGTTPTTTADIIPDASPTSRPSPTPSTGSVGSPTAELPTSTPTATVQAPTIGPTATQAERLEASLTAVASAPEPDGGFRPVADAGDFLGALPQTLRTCVEEKYPGDTFGSALNGFIEAQRRQIEDDETYLGLTGPLQECLQQGDNADELGGQALISSLRASIPTEPDRFGIAPLDLPEEAGVLSALLSDLPEELEGLSKRRPPSSPSGSLESSGIGLVGYVETEGAPPRIQLVIDGTAGSGGPTPAGARLITQTVINIGGIPPVAAGISDGIIWIEVNAPELPVRALIFAEEDGDWLFEAAARNEAGLVSLLDAVKIAVGGA